MCRAGLYVIWWCSLHVPESSELLNPTQPRCPSEIRAGLGLVTAPSTITGQRSTRITVQGCPDSGNCPCTVLSTKSRHRSSHSPGMPGVQPGLPSDSHRSSVVCITACHLRNVPSTATCCSNTGLFPAPFQIQHVPPLQPRIVLGMSRGCFFQAPELFQCQSRLTSPCKIILARPQPAILILQDFTMWALTTGHS